MTATARLPSRPDVVMPPWCRDMIHRGALVAVSHYGESLAM